MQASRQVGVVAYLCGGFGHEGGLQQEVEGGFLAVVEGVGDELPGRGRQWRTYWAAGC